MILCIDAGNTRVKFGLRADAHWLLRDAVGHDELADVPARLAVQPAPTRIIACSVAGESINQRITQLAAHWQIPLAWLRSAPASHGVSNGYANPSQLGNDRWAALIGARGLCTTACLVVMAGTATTIDALDSTGHFHGGLILPGLSLMRSALARNTAQLPLAEGHFQPWPITTDDAITSGVLAATVGAIERMRQQLQKLQHLQQQAPSVTCACLLSGGAAEALLPLLGDTVRLQPDLVLEGLARVAETSAESRHA